MNMTPKKKTAKKWMWPKKETNQTSEHNLKIIIIVSSEESNWNIYINPIMFGGFFWSGSTFKRVNVVHRNFLIFPKYQKQKF